MNYGFTKLTHNYILYMLLNISLVSGVSRACLLLQRPYFAVAIAFVKATEEMDSSIYIYIYILTYISR